MSSSSFFGEKEEVKSLRTQRDFFAVPSPPSRRPEGWEGLEGGHLPYLPGGRKVGKGWKGVAFPTFPGVGRLGRVGKKWFAGPRTRGAGLGGTKRGFSRFSEFDSPAARFGPREKNRFFTGYFLPPTAQTFFHGGKAGGNSEGFRATIFDKFGG